MGEWKKIRFGDLYAIPSRNGVSKPSRVRGAGYKMINMGELFAHNWIFDIPMELVPLNDSEKANSQVVVDDLLFARQSMVASGAGRCVIVREVNELTVFESHLIRVRLDQAKALPLFYYYYFRSGCSNIASIVQHVVQAGIRASDLSDLEVDLPDLPTQRRIAAVLGALDDKIEVNRKICENLEAQAQALFKAWFVDFEPFGGKRPEGWKIYRLGDFFPVRTGKKDVNCTVNEGEYPFFSCAQDALRTNDYSFDGNAVLVAGNGDFNVKWYNGKFEAYQRTYVLMPRDPRLTCWLFYVIKYNLKHITQSAQGSVIKFITKGHLENFEFFAPMDLEGSKLIQKFQSIREFIALKERESRALAAMRDALLPKLMSGEIAVEKVEVGDACASYAG